MSNNRQVKPRIVMPLASVIATAVLAFGVGVFVGRDMPSGKSAAPHGGMPPVQAEEQAVTPVDSPAMTARIQASGERSELVSIGNEMYDANQYALSAAAYEKALKLDGNDANVRTDLAAMYRKLGRADDAVSQLREAIRIDPKHENSRYNLGVVLLHDKSDMDAAVSAWQDYIKIFPEGEHAERVRTILANVAR